MRKWNESALKVVNDVHMRSIEKHAGCKSDIFKIDEISKNVGSLTLKKNVVVLFH